MSESDNDKADFDRHVELEERLLELGGDDPDKLQQIIFELCQKVGIEELEQVIALVESEPD